MDDKMKQEQEDADKKLKERIDARKSRKSILNTKKEDADAVDSVDVKDGAVLGHDVDQDEEEKDDGNGEEVKDDKENTETDVEWELSGDVGRGPSHESTLS